jgi:CheY-like chemotaxis protein
VVGGKETVLVVDDDRVIVKLVGEMLRPLGYEVLTAADPTEALALGERHPGAIDLVVTDLLMPGMNGRDLARLLRERHASVRTLFMSGYASDVVSPELLRELGASLLAKPFTPQQLGHAIRRLLDAPAPSPE